MFSALPLWAQFLASFSFIFLCAYTACTFAFSNWFAVALAVTVSGANGSLLFKLLNGFVRVPSFCLAAVIGIIFFFLWFANSITVGYSSSEYSLFKGFTVFNIVSACLYRCFIFF